MKQSEVNRLINTRPWERYDSGEGSLSQRSYYIPEGSTEFILLNGEWDFIFAESINDLDLSNKPNKIPVPACWQMVGYDSHQYLNVRYPFAFRPPFVPNANPCGLYAKTLVLDTLPHKNTYIRLEGVDSFYCLYVNEKYVGCHMISHSGAEFDITPFLFNGENHIEILVFKWSTGTYFEDQDKLRMSGIFRDVYILRREKEHLWDFTVNAIFENDYKSCKVFVDIPKTKGKEKTVELLYKGEVIASRFGNEEKFIFNLNNPKIWSAEKPELYETVIKCGGEIIRQSTALREIKVEDGIVKVNGQPIKFKGVNRHESYFDSGYVVDREKIIADLRLMKENNITAIRASHYPNDPIFYGLCDEYGFYVIDEADIETHGTVALRGWYDFDLYDVLTDDLRFNEIVCSRVTAMYNRDKNFGSILFWSLGNEAGWGKCMINAAKKMKALDSYRLLHYESVFGKDENVKLDGDLDVCSMMYPSLDKIRDFLKKPNETRPLLLCEYSHAMGNSCGDVLDYQRLIESEERLAGAFIWEWNDHAAPDKGGLPCYGGDFGETLHDKNYCVDGMLSYKREPFSSLAEVKQVFKPLEIVKTDKVWAVIDKSDFINIKDEFIIKAKELFFDGKERTTELDFNAVPSFAPSNLAYGVVFEFLHNKTNGLVKKGHSAGFSSFLLKPFNNYPQTNQTTVTVDKKENDISVKAGRTVFVFSRTTGMPISIQKDGSEFLNGETCVNIKRALIDNDRNIQKKWIEKGVYLSEFYADNISFSDNKLTVNFSARADSFASVTWGTIVYSFMENGLDIQTKAYVRDDIPFLPRFGFVFNLRKNMDSVKYFGYGTDESYIDKTRLAVKGLHKLNVRKQNCPYLMPQEYGSHFDTNYFEVSDKNNTLCIWGESGFSFSALPYSLRQLNETQHEFKLKKENRSVISIDYKMSGVGSASVGPQLAEEYQLNEKEFDWNIKLLIK